MCECGIGRWYQKKTTKDHYKQRRQEKVTIWEEKDVEKWIKMCAVQQERRQSTTK